MRFLGLILILLFSFGTNEMAAQYFQHLIEYESAALNTEFLNPDNIAKDADKSLRYVLKFNKSERIFKGLLTAEFRANFNIDKVQQSNSKSIWNNENNFDLQELYYTTSGSNFSFSFGRKKINWGVSYVSSPTSIITAAPNAEDPDDRLYQIGGSDVVNLSMIGDVQQLDLLYLPNTTNNKGFTNNHSIALRYYHYLSPLEIGFVSRFDIDFKGQLGMNSTIALGNSIELHAEYLYQSHFSGFYPEDVSMLSLKEFEKPLHRVIFGGQWSPSLRWNWVFEYLFNSAGYEAMQWIDFQDIVSGFQDNLTIPELRVPTEMTLVDLYHRTTAPIRRHYAFNRFEYSNLNSTFSLEIIHFLNLHDGSGSVRIGNRIKFTQSANIKFFTQYQISLGSEGSEFENLIRGNIFRFGLIFIR